MKPKHPTAVVHAGSVLRLETVASPVPKTQEKTTWTVGSGIRRDDTGHSYICRPEHTYRTLAD